MESETIIKRVIEIEGTQAFETLADMAKAAEDAKKKLKELDKGSEEYQAQLVASKKLQKDYNATLKLTTNAADGLKGSYYDLNKQLVEARKQWKSLSAEERDADAKLGEKGLLGRIQKLDTELKSLDDTIGQHQRHVGDYKGQIAQISGLFGAAGQSASGAVSGIMSMKGAMDAAAANPLIAMVTALVAIMGKLSEAFKSSEAATMALSEAFAPFKAIGQAMTNMFTNLAKGAANLAQKIVNLADKWGLLNERAKENMAITKEENALTRDRRRIEEENARLSYESAAARTLAADKSAHSAKERLAALESAAEAEKQILNNDLYIAQKELELAERRAALTDNNAETNDALSRARANLWSVREAYEQGMRRIVTQMDSTRKEIAAEGKKVEQTIVDDEIATIEAADAAIMAEADKQYQRERTARLKAEEQRKKDAEARKKAEAKELAELAQQNIQANEKRVADEKAARDRLLASYQKYSQAVSSIMQSVASAWAQQIQAQVEAGKISEEEGARQFKLVKAFQCAQTIINTAAGVVAAFTAPDNVTMAQRIASAAAVAATGAASAIQISQTSLGSATSAGGSLGAPIQTISTTAPAVIQQVGQQTTLTGADVEDILNRKMDALKVEFVWSDYERKAGERALQLSGSRFRPAAG